MDDLRACTGRGGRGKLCGGIERGRWYERCTEEVIIMPQKRTTHRSATGKKLYAVRDEQGRFRDIQSYKRAHSQDIRRKAKGEK
jgi:hypothetical protein